MCFTLVDKHCSWLAYLLFRFKICVQTFLFSISAQKIHPLNISNSVNPTLSGCLGFKRRQENSWGRQLSKHVKVIVAC